MEEETVPRGVQWTKFQWFKFALIMILILCVVVWLGYGIRTSVDGDPTWNIFELNYWKKLFSG